jgi:hypothetical protein
MPSASVFQQPASEPDGTAVTLNEYAIADAGIPQELLRIG